MSRTRDQLKIALEKRGIEPRTCRMQSGRATTVPHPHVTTVGKTINVLYCTKDWKPKKCDIDYFLCITSLSHSITNEQTKLQLYSQCLLLQKLLHILSSNILYNLPANDLATYVGFVDLVKAYNTANHTLLLCILERYGAPPKFVAAIQTIYTNNICVLKIEKEIVEIPQSVGVRQGDNMAPVLFLFLVTAFAETIG